MSSILRALKKLENEFPQKNEVLFRPQKTDTKWTISKHGKRNWLFKKSLHLVLVLVILTIGGWLIFGPKPLLLKSLFPWTISLERDKRAAKIALIPEKNTPDRSPTPVLKIRTSSMKTKGISEGSASRPNLIRKETSAGGNINKYEPDNKSVKGKSVPIREKQKHMPAPVSKTEIVSRERGGIPERETLNYEPPQMEISTREDVAKYEPDRESAGMKSIPAKPIDDSRLELQAIAWSRNPKERIAVISGRVVREGAFFNNFSIARIGKDEVIVREGNEYRRLTFRLK